MEEQFLAVIGDGLSKAKIIKALGIDEIKYNEVLTSLKNSGKVKVGRGRGGHVTKTEAV